MRVIVDRWVTPAMVILAAASVVFAATWTMASRFSGPDQFASGNAPRSAQGPVGRLGAAVQTSAVGAPIGSGPARQAPISAGGGVAQSVAPAASGGQPPQAPVTRSGLAPVGASGATASGMAPVSGDPSAAPRQRDGGRQGARVAGAEGDDHVDGSSGERSSGERTGRSRDRH